MAELKYRGRIITQAHLLYIREMIAAHPGASRRRLSQKLCEAWQWRQANGAFSDMVCRGLLVMLERAGQITLPPVRYVRHNPLAKRVRPAPLLIDSTPIEARLGELGPLEFQLVRRTGEEPLFNSLLEQHHYLHYEQPVGAQLKYLLWAQSRPIACLAWSSAPRHLGARDRYIGWSAEARRRNVRFLAYNSRFLLLPWVRVKNLASHILGRMVVRISQDWENRYGYPLYFLETSWIRSGSGALATTLPTGCGWERPRGEARASNRHVPNRSIKHVLGYSLHPRFRQLLGELG
jgi:hypothetical protein